MVAVKSIKINIYHLHFVFFEIDMNTLQALVGLVAHGAVRNFADPDVYPVFVEDVKAREHSHLAIIGDRAHANDTLTYIIFTVVHSY